MTNLDADLLKQSVESDNIPAVAELLARNPAWLDLLNADGGSGWHQILATMKSPGMADLFLTHGLTPAMVSEGWARGFGLHTVSTGVAEHLIACGAAITPHAAAALGLVDRLRSMLDQDPDLVHAKGGDGGRPLHFSRNVEIARLLVERGAELDPRDDDHDSTPAQWRIGDAPEVTRFLLSRGARPDIFMAAGLNDLALAAELIREETACTTHRIGNNSGPFPGIGFQGRGGTIYQWTLGFNQAPQEVAHHRGHRDMFALLMRHTPPRQQLLVACMLADRSSAERIAAEHPGLIGELNEEDRSLLAKCCWETNLNSDAVRLMLDLGFPMAVPEFNHGFSPLHNAAWCGDPELVELLLQRGHPVDRRDPVYHATALGFAIHSCVKAQRHPDGDFPRVVELLLTAGVPLDEGQFPTDHAGLDQVIQRTLDL